MNDMIRRDLKHIWHPYTQMKDCQKMPPIFIDKAKGIKLYDDKGNFYYDTISSWWCNVHGHNHPRIKNAIKRQLDRLEHVLFAGFTHEKAILLAERLVAISPKNLTKVFFSDNGSTAVETALKLSFQYWNNIGHAKKNKFISLDRGYHGDTVGAMSVSGVGMFNVIFKDLLFKSYKAPAPYCYRCPMVKRGQAFLSSNAKEKCLSPFYPACSFECVKALEAILKKNSSQISAFILEPLVMAAGGMIIYPKEYLAAAAGLAKKYNVHLIVDEVATGFGRTGKMFACDHVNIAPDFMCLSKGITSGYLSLGATLTSDEIYDAFYGDDKAKTFYHGHTYTANPVSCAAALASLELFREEDTLGRVKGLAPMFRDQLDGLRRLPVVGDVRSIGMIGAIELVRDKKTKEMFDPERRLSLDIYRAGLERSIILRPLGDVIYLFPPLSVKECELDYILKAAGEVIECIRP